MKKFFQENKSKLCVIVDGYSTGANYVSVLKNMGYECLHLQSSSQLPEWLPAQVEKGLYRDYAVHYGDLRETAKWIMKYGNPRFIISGYDAGTRLADKLSNYFKLPTTNEMDRSEARKDKFLMMEEISKAGIRSIQQIKTRNLDEVEPWMQKNNLQFPIIVKPIASCSGEGFFRCKNIEDVRNAFAKTLDKGDLFNQVNKEMLVQECIDGKEYVVNTVSCAGRHFAVEFCEYEKFLNVDGNLLYRSISFLPRNFVLAEKLQNYAFSVISALGVKYGPVHVEIMIDQKGPVLIEIGARPMGARLDLGLVNKSYGNNQVELSALCYTSNENFLKRTETLCDDLKAQLRLVFVVPNKEGVFDQISLAALQELASFKKLDVYGKQGSKIYPAHHFDDSVGMVYLQHEEKDIIEADTQKICELEKNGQLILYKDQIQNDANAKQQIRG